jgi:hypothetical protein
LRVCFELTMFSRSLILKVAYRGTRLTGCTTA